MSVKPAGAKHSPNVDTSLCHRLRRWPNAVSTLSESLLFAGKPAMQTGQMPPLFPAPFSSSITGTRPCGTQISLRMQKYLSSKADRTEISRFRRELAINYFSYFTAAARREHDG